MFLHSSILHNRLYFIDAKNLFFVYHRTNVEEIQILQRNNYIVLSSPAHPNIFKGRFKVFRLDSCIEHGQFIKCQTMGKLAVNIYIILLPSSLKSQ